MVLNLQLLQGFQQFTDIIHFNQLKKRKRNYNSNNKFSRIFVKFKDEGNNTCLLRALMVPLIVNRKVIIENESPINEQLEYDWKNLPPPVINGTFGNIEDIIAFIGNVSTRDLKGRRQLGIINNGKSDSIKISNQEAIIISIQPKLIVEEIIPDNNSGILFLKNRNNTRWESDYYIGQRRYTNTNNSEIWTSYVIIKFGNQIKSLLGQQLSEEKNKEYDTFVVKPSIYHTPLFQEIYNISFSSGNFYHTRSAEYWKRHQILQT